MNAKKSLKYIVFVVVVGNLALLAYVLLGTAQPKPAPMPNPNGYDDFVKAAAVLKGSPADYKTMKPDELAELVSANAAALKSLETGITRKCRVPDDHSMAHFNGTTFPLLAKWKQFGSLFCAEGKLAESEGRTNDAIKLYLEGMRFGEECARGGTFIEKLVGVACQTMDSRPLENLQTNLGAKQCAGIAREIEVIDAGEETDEDVLQNEIAFGNANGGIRWQIAKIFMYKSIKENREKALAKIHNLATQRRQLMLKFAARAYELDKGKPPASPADLVPGYLQKIPPDAATGTNLVLHP